MLDAYRRIGKEYARLCCVYATAVFVTPELLQRGFAELDRSGADSVVTVLRYSTPIERAMRIEGGRLRMADPRHVETRSPDLEASYHDAGQCYWLRTAAFLEQKAIFARHTVPLVLDPMQAQDIDTEDDWLVAEFKYSYLQTRRKE